MKRLLMWAVGALATAGALTAGALRLGLPANSEEPQPPESGPARPPVTATVTRRDLEERETLNGTLGYGEARAIASALQGTVTALPSEGTVVEGGQPLAIVDRHRVTLMYGATPAWRTLETGVSDGEDVRQLEDNLAALGYFTRVPDAHFDWRTREALQAWQDDTGVEEDGRVDLGEVVFLPGPVRVASHLVDVGGAAGQPLLEVSGTERLVTLNVDADDRALFAPGAPVSVELPGGTTTAGKVRDVGRVGEADPDDPDAEPTFTVTVTLDDPAAAGDLDAAPVSVEVVRAAARGVLAVPVHALLARADASGYAVEVVGDGATRLVPVEVGAFADGWVEVIGDLAEGDEVVTAA